MSVQTGPPTPFHSEKAADDWQRPISAQTAPSIPFHWLAWAEWVLINGIAGVIGVALLFMPETRRLAFNPQAPSVVGSIVLFSLMLGTLQSFVLRLPLGQAVRWVLLSALGALLAWAAILAWLSLGLLGGGVGWVVIGAAAGAILGFMQARALPLNDADRKHWVVSSSIGWAVAIAIGATIPDGLRLATVDSLKHLPRDELRPMWAYHLHFNPDDFRLLRSPGAEYLGLVLIGPIQAAFTGLALSRLLRGQRSPED
jgi:hypothetical protein